MVRVYLAAANDPPIVALPPPAVNEYLPPTVGARFSEWSSVRQSLSTLPTCSPFWRLPPPLALPAEASIALEANANSLWVSHLVQHLCRQVERTPRTGLPKWRLDRYGVGLGTGSFCGMEHA